MSWASGCQSARMTVPICCRAMKRPNRANEMKPPTCCSNSPLPKSLPTVMPKRFNAPISMSESTWNSQMESRTSRLVRYPKAAMTKLNLTCSGGKSCPNEMAVLWVGPMGMIGRLCQKRGRIFQDKMNKPMPNPVQNNLFLKNPICPDAVS